MKTLVLFAFIYPIKISNAYAQKAIEIERSILDCVEGLYYGDTLKIKRSMPKFIKICSIAKKRFNWNV